MSAPRLRSVVLSKLKVCPSFTSRVVSLIFTANCRNAPTPFTCRTASLENEIAPWFRVVAPESSNVAPSTSLMPVEDSRSCPSFPASSREFPSARWKGASNASSAFPRAKVPLPARVRLSITKARVELPETLSLQAWGVLSAMRRLAPGSALVRAICCTRVPSSISTKTLAPELRRTRLSEVLARVPPPRMVRVAPPTSRGVGVLGR